MLTHHWASGQGKSQGGHFVDDDEKIICEWTFDSESKVLTVRHGFVSRPTDLSGFGIDKLEEVELRERLVELAGEVCEQLQSEASGE